MSLEPMSKKFYFCDEVFSEPEVQLVAQGDTCFKVSTFWDTKSSEKNIISMAKSVKSVLTLYASTPYNRLIKPNHPQIWKMYLNLLSYYG